MHALVVRLSLPAKILSLRRTKMAECALTYSISSNQPSHAVANDRDVFQAAVGIHAFLQLGCQPLTTAVYPIKRLQRRKICIACRYTSRLTPDFVLDPCQSEHCV